MEHQSAARAAEHSVESGAVCDRDGVVEPPRPVPGLEQPGGQTERSASSRARQRHQRFRAESTPHGAGSQGLQMLMQERCRLLGTPQDMPSAFFGRYRLMAIDGTLFHLPDTKANAVAFGRSSNQYGPGAYPQVKCVLLAQCGSHAVVGLEMDRYDVSKVHGANRLLSQIGTRHAGVSGCRADLRRLHRAGTPAQSDVLGALEAGAWEQPKRARRLADGSVLAWVMPSHSGRYRQQRGMWVRIISYRVTDARVGKARQDLSAGDHVAQSACGSSDTLITLYHERWEMELVIDEIKTHERGQRKVLRSKTPEGVRQELFGIYLAHYAVRALLAQASIEAALDPDRLSFSEGLFELTEMLSLAQTVEPEEALEPLVGACGTN